MASVGTILLAAIIGWTGLTDANRLGGRMVSSGYLRGRVVMVHSADGALDQAILPRLQDVWTSFKTKPFVLLGSVRDANVPATKAALAKSGVTFPVYADAALEKGGPAAAKFYVVDNFGKVIYSGSGDREATEAVVNALTRLASPPDAATYVRLIEAEKDLLPGLAYLHLRDMRKHHSNDARRFDALWRTLAGDREVVKLSRLEEAAKIARDFDPTNKKTKMSVTPAKIVRVAKLYEPLKKAADANRAQEAKNCLADMAWAAAALKKK